MTLTDLRKPDGATTLAISVEGMSCASCVGRVEKAILAVPGVREASVNLATQRASVGLDANADAAPVLAAIRAAGYTPQEDETDFSVEGMSCASCVGRVERALLAVPGVLEGRVNLATGRAHARHVGGQGTVAAIVSALA
ncbi:MAG: copper ion binding protein, partial [Hyphomicrobiales bacterium]